MHVHEMTGPPGEIVKDVRCVHDRAGPTLRLSLQPVEKAAAREEVEIDGDFVEQEDLPGPHETHG